MHAKKRPDQFVQALKKAANAAFFNYIKQKILFEKKGETLLQ